MKQVQRGFTLVELLVVISIIALLLSILMPSLNKARESAKRIVCKNNIRQVGLAHIVYAQDYRGMFYIARNPYANPSGPATQFYGNTFHNYPNYWPNPNFINFGKNAAGEPLEPLTTGKYTSKDMFYCPNYFQVFNKNGSKKAAWLASEMGIIQFVNAFYQNYGKNMTRMRFEYMDKGLRTGAWKMVPMANVANSKSSQAMAQDVCMQENQYLGTNTFKAVHKDGVNVSFTDGHTDFIRHKELDNKNFRATGNSSQGNWSMYPDQM